MCSVCALMPVSVQLKLHERVGDCVLCVCICVGMCVTVC